MTKKERKFLRAAYHHFQFLQEKPSNDQGKIAKVILSAPVMQSIVLHVLSLEGDEDGYKEDQLNEIFEQHNIEFLN